MTAVGRCTYCAWLGCLLVSCWLDIIFITIDTSPMTGTNEISNSAMNECGLDYLPTQTPVTLNIHAVYIVLECLC